MRNPAKDPNGGKLAARRARAAATFTDAFDRQRRQGCPTGRHRGRARGARRRPGRRRRDRHDRVSRTSPTTPSPRSRPPAPRSTSGRPSHPTCINGTPYHFFVKRGTGQQAPHVLPGRRRVLGAAHLRRAGVRRQRRRPGRQPERRVQRLLRSRPTRATRSGTGTSCSCRTAAATSTSATRRRTTTTIR